MSPAVDTTKSKDVPVGLSGLHRKTPRRGDRPILVHTIRLHVDWANKNSCQGSSPRSIATTPVKKAYELTRLSSFGFGYLAFPALRAKRDGMFCFV